MSSDNETISSFKIYGTLFHVLFSLLNNENNNNKNNKKLIGSVQEPFAFNPHDILFIK